jgi:ABC-type antimicrobial peptide transport system permease subunit
LLIAEYAFTRRFPGEAGHRVFLVDAPTSSEVAGDLTRALSDFGFEAEPAADRLNRFNAVQNTYLNTFQVLGGLGLLLGSFGLGLVVMRNVQERRAELAVLGAVGFAPGRVEALVLREHRRLLLEGIWVGTASALLAVAPTLLQPGGGFPWAGIALVLAAVLANGLLWTWVATRRACGGPLLTALRGE